MPKMILIIAGAGAFAIAGAVGFTQIHELSQQGAISTPTPVAQMTEPAAKPLTTLSVEGTVQNAAEAPRAETSVAEDVAATEPETIVPTAPEEEIVVIPPSARPQTAAEILGEAEVETYVPGFEEERNGFVAEPTVSRVPLDVGQEGPRDPVTSIVRDDRPADDRRIKQTWSVGVYR